MHNNMASNSGSDKERLLLRELVDAAWKSDTAAVQRALPSASDAVLNGSADIEGQMSLFTALRAASHQGSLDIVQLLLQHGADVNVINQYGETALCTATLQNQVPVVRALLQHEHEPQLLNRALASASFEGHADIARLLLQHGAHVGWPDLQGRTPLQTAVQLGHAETTRVLLEYGADANARNSSSGRTLLHKVACTTTTNVRILQALLEYGADQRIRGRDGKTALELACENDRLSAIYVLLQSGIGDGTITFL